MEIVYKPCVPAIAKSTDTHYDYQTKCLVHSSNKADYLKKLQEVKNYVQMPDLLFAHNLEDTNLQSSGSASIFRETVIFDYQWTTSPPSFLVSHLHRDRLQDSAFSKYDYFYLTFG